MTTRVYECVILLLAIGIGILVWNPNDTVVIRERFQRFTKATNEKTLDRTRTKKVRLELAQCISFLRNSIADQSYLPSLEMILSELANRDSCLTHAYAGMLRLIRQNDFEGALSCFTDVAGESEGKDIGRLLLSWDTLPPQELSETLLSYQKHLSEMRFTEQVKQDEIISDLLYLPVVWNVLLVFLNFIYVGYFLDQKEMLNILF